MKAIYFEESFITVTTSREADITLVGKYHTPSISKNTSRRKYLITVLQKIIAEKKVFLRRRLHYEPRRNSERCVYLKSRAYRLKRDFFKKEEVLKLEIHPDYNFDKICHELGLPFSHISNLLLLISNILSFDFGAHFDFKSEEIDAVRIEEQENKLPKFLKYMEELAVLTAIKEGNGEVTFKIHTNSKGYFKVTSNEEIMLVANFMRERRINELKSLSYDLIFDIHNIENWSSLHLKDYANKLKRKPVGDKVQKFLSISVSQTILEYLKGEKLLMSKHEKVKMSQKQGVVIYTFLLVFNILKKTEASKKRSTEDKAKYIHSLLDEKKNLKGINIAQLEWEEIPIEKYLSDYQDVTIPHRF